MKKALLLLGAVALSSSVFAQNGDMNFSNRNVPKAAGDGSTYNIPIWAMGGTGTDGAGDLPGGVTAALFLPGNSTPLVSVLLRTDANSQFLATSTTAFQVPGFGPGSTPTLEFKAWQGPGTYAEALAAGRQVTDPNSPITFTTRPLGGTPAGGGLPITPPNVTGLGSETGTGFTLTVVPEPSTLALGALGIGAMLLRRRK